MTKMKKTIAILLVVLFLVTVTASAVSASSLVTHPASAIGVKNPYNAWYLAVGPMGPTPFPTVYNKPEGSATVTTTTLLLQPALFANFTAHPISGKAPLMVFFEDKSIGNPTGWEWHLGDGSVSTLQNPIHTYSHKGQFTVDLKITRGELYNMTSKMYYIKIS
jgi:PKD repeat protein